MTLLYELADPEKESHHILYDSMGLWLVGPVSVECKHLSPGDHLFWGASHPKAEDVPRQNYKCGFPATSYQAAPPFR